MNKTLEDIANDMIDGSDGSFYLYESDEFLALSLEEQQDVLNVVLKEISACGECGWHFHIDHLEHHGKNDEPVCWECYNALDEEEEDV